MNVDDITSHYKAVSTNANKTKTFECVKCRKKITSQGTSKLKHHVAQIPGQRGQEVSKCANPDKLMNAHWKKMILAEVAKKRESGGSSSGFPSSGESSKKSRYSGGIARHFQSQDREEADKSLVRWLASAGLPPNVTENEEFKIFLKNAGQAGPAYKPPERHQLGMVDGNLGPVLQKCLDETRDDVKLAMLPLKQMKVCALFMNLMIFAPASNAMPPSFPRVCRGHSAPTGRGTWAAMLSIPFSIPGSGTSSGSVPTQPESTRMPSSFTQTSKWSS